MPNYNFKNLKERNRNAMIYLNKVNPKNNVLKYDQYGALTLITWDKVSSWETRQTIYKVSLPFSIPGNSAIRG